ncbi:hypothetical protein MRX96_008335 [Rhipicephalus microplus]
MATRATPGCRATSGIEVGITSPPPPVDSQALQTEESASPVPERLPRLETLQKGAYIFKDKINIYVSKIASLVPTCKAMSRKLEKLTILRMVVQHIKTMRGSINSYMKGHFKPRGCWTRTSKTLSYRC